MTLAQIDRNNPIELSIAQKSKIIFDYPECDQAIGDVAILLGSSPELCHERASAAAKLYNDGKVKYIIASGGVEWEHNGKRQSEADMMAQILEELSVPREAIIKDNDARTTEENMIFGILQINRRIKFYNIKKVYIVTSEWHLRRSLALAEFYMPKSIEILGFPARNKKIAIDNWFKNEKALVYIDTEIRIMKDLIDKKIISDIEF